MSGTAAAGELRSNALQAEAAGFDVVHSSDHVGEVRSPLAPLAAVTNTTQHIRVCPLLLNNDFHHSVELARGIAALDHLTAVASRSVSEPAVPLT